MKSNGIQPTNIAAIHSDIQAKNKTVVIDGTISFLDGVKFIIHYLN